MKLLRRMAALVLLSTAVACSPSTRWDKAGSTDDDIAIAVQSCNAEVARELRKSRFARQERFTGRDNSVVGIGGSRQTAVAQRFEEAEYRRVKDQLFATCMVRQGFRQIPADAPKPTNKKTPPTKPLRT